MQFASAVSEPEIQNAVSDPEPIPEPMMIPAAPVATPMNYDWNTQESNASMRKRKRKQNSSIASFFKANKKVACQGELS